MRCGIMVIGCFDGGNSCTDVMITTTITTSGGGGGGGGDG